MPSSPICQAEEHLWQLEGPEISKCLSEKISHMLCCMLQVMFFPSHHDYQEPAVTRRVMDYFKFMNSKVLFKQVSTLVKYAIRHKMFSSYCPSKSCVGSARHGLPVDGILQIISPLIIRCTSAFLGRSAGRAGDHISTTVLHKSSSTVFSKGSLAAGKA